MKIPVLCLIMAFLVTCPAQADPVSIGTIKTIKGDVFVIRETARTPMNIGDRLYSGDMLQTHTNSSAGIIFEDNTVLSLGPDTEININDYVFVPENALFSMIVEIFNGTAAYLSGIIGQQAPGAVKFHTPDATIGIRGTQFLVKVDK
jgi:hypothetical protein